MSSSLPRLSFLGCQLSRRCGWRAVGFGALISGSENLTSLHAKANLATPPGNNIKSLPQEPQEQRKAPLNSYKSEAGDPEDPEILRAKKKKGGGGLEQWFSNLDALESSGAGKTFGCPSPSLDFSFHQEHWRAW